MTPAQILQSIYDRATATLEKSIIDHREMRERIDYVCRCISNRAGVRLSLGLQGSNLIPSFVRITTAKISERAVAWECLYDPGTILCFDRGYFNPSWFTTIAERGCVFLTRWKSDTSCKVLRRLNIEKGSSVIADEIIRFSGPESGVHCYLELRRITYVNPQTGKTLIFLTNQREWPALMIADLYRLRWQIETFFRWLKQTLKLRRFWSVCENGIKWQIWSALILYLLLKLLLLECQSGWSLLTLMRKMAALMLEPVKLHDLLEREKHPHNLNTCICSAYS